MPQNEVFYNQKTHFLLNSGIPARLTSVMSSHYVSSKTLLQIAEDLESEDQDVILFACRHVTSHTNIQELLSELNERSVFAVVEILCLVKRFDLLKKYLKLTKTEAEHQVTPETRVISDYSKLLTDFNEQLDEEDLESLMFLLRKDLRNGGRLNKKTFLCLASEMEKNRLITPENLDLLEQSFLTIRRLDLKNKICKFKEKDQPTQGHYINAFAVSPAIPRTQSPIPVKQWSTINGHEASTPVQETRPSVQETRCAQAELNEERYAVRPEPLGFCLIIDCLGNDADLLEYTFISLNFIVKCHKHKRVHEVKEILQETADMDQHNNDIFICILISRGDNKSLFFEDGCLPGLSLRSIKKKFNGQSCPNLIGKPKLFFIQNYITDDCEVQPDGGSMKVDGPSCNAERKNAFANTPNEADIFWSICKYHCIAEDWELRFSGLESMYLKVLTELLTDKKKRKCHDIQQIHTELNYRIYRETGYSLVLQHTLTRKLFLHPA